VGRLVRLATGAAAPAGPAGAAAATGRLRPWAGPKDDQGRCCCTRGPTGRTTGPCCAAPGSCSTAASAARATAAPSTPPPAASGPVYRRDAGPREAAPSARARHACVCYPAADLEPVLAHYLEHEDERRRLAAAARAKVAQYSFADLWDGSLGVVAAEWEALTE